MIFVCAAFLGVVSSSCQAQPTLTMIGFNPGLSPTSATQIELQYNVTSSSATAVNLWFQRDDGAQTAVTNVIPGTGPFSVIVPLPSGVDEVTTFYSGLVQQPPGSIVAGDRMLQIVVDDTGPGFITVTNPVFPLTTFDSTITASGEIRRANNAIDPNGRVEVTREDAGNSGTVIGGGVVNSAGHFNAAIDLSAFPSGTAIPIRFHSFDRAGNAGTTTDGTITYQSGGGAVSLTGLSMTPPNNTVTNNPAVLIKGTVQGDAGPFTVTFLVDGFVQSTLTNLASSTPFGHTMTLPGEGTHTIEVRATNSAGATIGPETLGAITLDRTPPAPPIITSPNPSAPFHTSANTFTIAGVAPESGPQNGTAKIYMKALKGISFSPSQPQEITDPSGTFSTTVDISSLPDGMYVIEVYYIDGAGNYSEPPARYTVGSRAGAPSAPSSPMLDSARYIEELLDNGKGSEILHRASKSFRQQGRRRAFNTLHR